MNRDQTNNRFNVYYYSVREPLHTKLDNDKTICKRRVNRDQTYNRFNVYCLLTKRLTLGCFHKIT